MQTARPTHSHNIDHTICACEHVYVNLRASVCDSHILCIYVKLFDPLSLAGSCVCVCVCVCVCIMMWVCMSVGMSFCVHECECTRAGVRACNVIYVHVNVACICARAPVEIMHIYLCV